MKNDDASRQFGRLLETYVREGFRPSGKPKLPPTRRRASFAEAIGRDPRTLPNYFSGTTRPHKIDDILDALFDPADENAEHAGHRAKLRAAWEAAWGVEYERPRWAGSLQELSPGECAFVFIVATASSPVPLAWAQGLLSENAARSRESLIAKHVLADEPAHAFEQTVRDVATNGVVERIADEVFAERPELLGLVPLVDTREPEQAIREHLRRVVGGVIRSLEQRSISRDAIAARLVSMLHGCRVRGDESYLAGNLVNLLAEAAHGLSGLALDGLVIRHGYLRSVLMHGTDLRNSRLVDCVFADTFGSIWQVGFRRDGAEVLASTVIGQVRDWSVETWSTRRIYGGNDDAHRGWSFGFALSNDEAELASAGGEGDIRVWSEAGRLLDVLSGHRSRVRAVGYLDDGAIVSCSEDTIVYRWPRGFARTRPVELYRHADRATTLAVRAGGRHIMSGSADGEIVFCDWRDPSGLVRVRAHEKEVRSLRFAQSGRCALSAGDDGQVLLWDSETFAPRPLFRLPVPAKAACFLGDSEEMIAAGSDDGRITLWQPPWTEPVCAWPAHDSLIRSLASSKDGTLIASGGDDQTLHVWRREAELSARPALLRSYSGYLSQVRALAFTPSGSLASAHDDGRIRLWNTETGKELLGKPIDAHRGRIWSLSFMADGEVLVSAGEDGELKAWRGNMLSPAWVGRGHDYRVFAIATRDTPTPLIASGGSDKTVRFWNLGVRDPVQTIAHAHHRRVRDVCFNPDGTTLASVGEDGAVILWEEEGEQWRELARQVEDVPVTSVRFTPDGAALVYVTDAAELVYWHLVSNQRSRVTLGARALLSLAIDPSGRFALAGSERGLVHPVLLEAMTALPALEAHHDWVEAIAFAPDGSSFATASDDQFIGIFDLDPIRERRKMKAGLPYEGLRIAGVTGIGPADRARLVALGAIDDGLPNFTPRSK